MFTSVSLPHAIYHVKLDSRGRVLVPVELRRNLGLKPGDRVVLTCTERGLLLQTLKQFEKSGAR
jgi:AbrB family looped-hinge helix DNA binding protein